MDITRLKNDLRTTWQVIREFREAVIRPSDQGPSFRAGNQATGEDIPAPWTGHGWAGAGRYISTRILIFLSASVVTFVPGSLIPHQQERFERKVSYLRENPDRYDIIFVGSSRIMLGLSPERMDAELQARGVQLGPSFNLGALESAMHQNFYTVRQLLDSNVTPRYLLIEAADFTSMLRSSHMKRFEVWHDLEETFRVLKTTLREARVPEFYGNRVERAWMHLLYCLRRYLPLGRMIEFIERDDPQIAVQDSFESTRGYQPLDQHRASDPEARRYFDNPSLWDGRIAELQAAYDGDYPQPVNVEAFHDLIHYVQAHGVQLVFIGTPHSTVEWTQPLLWMEQVGWVSNRPTPEGLPLFWNFNLPSLPYISNLDLRYDEDHVNNHGAQLWTEDVARVFAESLGT